jgi:O-antigen ligase
MLNKLQNEWRSTIIFILMLLMMICLFISRAGLSITAGLFLVVCFAGNNPITIFRTFLRDRILLAITILWLVVAVSGFWSTDQSTWIDNIRIKLPLLLFPLAFAAPFGFKIRDWKRLGYVFLLLMFAATVWMLVRYFQHRNIIDHAYLQAQTMWTPLGNDHVRFSWLIALAIFIAAILLWDRQGKFNWKAWLLTLLVVIFIIALHLLAARTGLVCFYIMIIGIAAWLLIKRKSVLTVLLLLMAPLLLFIAAWQLLPSFRNRVDYLLYDSGFSTKAHYLPGSTDAVRVISIRSGIEIMRESPLTGIGFGDIAKQTNIQYASDYPQMLVQDRILPSSEWIIYGVGAGWPGFILFFMVMVVPFTIRCRWPLGWWILNAMIGFSFLFDIGLETQYGVFIYTLALLCNWKWMVAEKM